MTGDPFPPADAADPAAATAFVFPGQGSQEPGMGRAFVDAWPEARAAFDRLDAAADRDLWALCFGDDADRLRRTEHTQPAVYAVGVAVAAAVRERYGVAPALVAGHSLGHFTAAAHAGLFDPVDGLALVTRRGMAMATAGRADGPGRMVAVLFADPEAVAAACDAVDGASVAAYNTPRGTVVSGREDAVAAVEDQITDRGRARFTDLDVGAAFHSPVMASAVDGVAAALADAPMAAASTPIVSDVSGRAYTDPAVACEELAAQVRAPVDWTGTVATLVDRGIERFVEFPPAGTLTRFVSRIEPDTEAVALADPDDAAALFRG